MALWADMQKTSIPSYGAVLLLRSKGGIPQKRGTFRSAQGTVQRVSAPFQHSIQHTAGLQTAPASGTSSSVLLGLYPGVMPSPLF